VKLSPTALASGALLVAGCASPKLATVAKPDSAPSTVLFSHVDVFDGEGTLRDRDVLVSSGLVRDLGPGGSLSAPSGAETVAGKGLTLLPGLVDVHVHLLSAGTPYWDLRRPDPEANGRALLYGGVTTALIANGSPDEVKYYRRTKAGLLAPHFFLAGPALGHPEGHPVKFMQALLPWPLGKLVAWTASTARTPEEARAEARRTKKKVDPAFFKIMLDDVPDGAPQLSTAAFEAAVSEAKALGMRPIVHVGKPSDMAEAARAGAALLMHTAYKDKLSEEDIRTIKAAGIPFVTTMRILAGMKDVPKTGGSPFEREVVEPKALESFRREPKDWTVQGFEEMRADADIYTLYIRSNIRKLVSAGVPFFVGTDTGLMGLFPGAAMHEELKAIVSMGFAPEQVLRAATSAPADFLDPARTFGRIRPGQRADLLLVRGDPTKEIEAVDAVEAVYLDGMRLERKEAPR
jgi:imidazolonepropionase-like amidohydrolase